MTSREPIRQTLREAGIHDERPCRLHAVSFADPDTALHAVKRLRSDGYTVADVHSPFPIHGIEDALGWRETRLGYVTLVGGLLGLALGLGLQAYTHGVDWPLNIGGKTDLAWPSMVPVIFELTVLLAAFATVFGFFFRRRLRPRWSSDIPVGQPGIEVSDDHFVLIVAEQDASFSEDGFRAICKELRPARVVEAWEVQP